MYDTLALKIDFLDTEKLEKLPCKEKAGRLIYSLKNLQISAAAGDQWYCIGSIAKYQKESNIYSLSNNEYLQALKSIETALNTDLKKSKVLRFDYGFCFYSRDTELLECLDYTTDTRVRKNTVSKGGRVETVSFGSREKELVFYRKDIEAGILQNGRALYRVENRYLKRQAVKRAFFGNDITPYALVLPKAKAMLKNNLVQTYNGIEKNVDCGLYCNVKQQNYRLKDVKNVFAALWVRENKRRFNALCTKLEAIDRKRLCKELATVNPPFYFQQTKKDEIDSAINNFFMYA